MGREYGNSQLCGLWLVYRGNPLLRGKSFHDDPERFWKLTGHSVRVESPHPLRGSLSKRRLTGGIALLIPRLHASAPSGQDT